MFVKMKSIFIPLSYCSECIQVHLCQMQPEREKISAPNILNIERKAEQQGKDSVCFSGNPNSDHKATGKSRHCFLTS